jgi:hypothetical protein
MISEVTQLDEHSRARSIGVKLRNQLHVRAS